MTSCSYWTANPGEHHHPTMQVKLQDRRVIDPFEFTRVDPKRSPQRFVLSQSMPEFQLGSSLAPCIVRVAFYVPSRRSMITSCALARMCQRSCSAVVDTLSRKCSYAEVPCLSALDTAGSSACHFASIPPGRARRGVDNLADRGTPCWRWRRGSVPDGERSG